MDQQPAVVISPLSWGLGHAGRCVPLIRQFLAKGEKVIIAGNGKAFDLLRKEFPDLEQMDVPGHEVHYSSRFPVELSLLLQAPLFIAATIKEFFWVRKLVKMRPVKLLVSDNRYGFRSPRVRSILVTHQLQVKSSVAQGVINSVNRWLISRFDECWVPDYAGAFNLGGELSHPEAVPSNVRYIGPLSRFMIRKSIPVADALAIISGPEPARSDFESMVTDWFETNDQRAFILRGKPGEADPVAAGGIKKLSHLNTREFESLLNSVPAVVSRSGYSTVMDLFLLKKKMFLAATAGQAEQEYLLQHLEKLQVASRIEFTRINKTAFSEEQQIPA